MYWITRHLRGGVDNRILFSYKIEGNPAICYNMTDLEGIVLSEIS